MESLKHVERCIDSEACRIPIQLHSRVVLLTEGVLAHPRILHLYLMVSNPNIPGPRAMWGVHAGVGNARRNASRQTATRDLPMRPSYLSDPMHMAAAECS